MVDKILSGIGVKYKAVRFLKPPKEPYVVYFHDTTYRGGDDLIAIEDHSLRLELYSETLQPELEEKIVQRLIDLKLGFDKGEPLWLGNSENTYMIAFYIEYTKKRSK